MEYYNFKSYLKRVLINGSVCYKNGTPIKNAMVSLEAFFPYKYNGLPVKYCRKCCGYTITDCKGKFYFYILNTRCYYKIKVFDNKYNNRPNIKNVKNLSCSIQLD